MRPLLRVDSLEVVMGPEAALGPFSFELAHGRVSAVVAPNGSGKTALLDAICGLRDWRGKIELDDGRLPASLAGCSAADVARRGVARSFEDSRVVGHASVLENVLMGTAGRSGIGLGEWLLATPRARAARRAMAAEADDLLAFWGLDGVRDVPAGGLRPGQQRIVELARAMAAHPRLLILDEPTRGAAPAELQAMLRRLRQLRERGVTILIAEAHLRSITGIADHVVVIGNGRVVAAGAPRVIRESAEAVALLRAEDVDAAS